MLIYHGLQRRKFLKKTFRRSEDPNRKINGNRELHFAKRTTEYKLEKQSSPLPPPTRCGLESRPSALPLGTTPLGGRADVERHTQVDEDPPIWPANREEEKPMRTW
jgi:hypothetical protein